MGLLPSTISRKAWLLCACVLLLPRLAAAVEPTLTLDFDGDGQADQVTVDRHEPSVLHVWLSANDTTQVIRTRMPLIRVIATDLDGDHRPEIIARDSDSQIHVWTRKRKGFHSYRPRKVIPGTLKQPNRRRVEDNEGNPVGVITSAPYAPLALALCASPRAPATGTAPAVALDAPRRSRTSTSLWSFAPRPPPLSHPF
jgi:hypothetical protein